MTTDPPTPVATDQPYTSPLVTELQASGVSRDWPVCANCRRATWMLDQKGPLAFCLEFNAMTYGEDREIKRCEAQDPLPPELERM